MIPAGFALSLWRRDKERWLSYAHHANEVATNAAFEMEGGRKERSFGEGKKGGKTPRRDDSFCPGETEKKSEEEEGEREPERKAERESEAPLWRM